MEIVGPYLVIHLKKSPSCTISVQKKLSGKEKKGCGNPDQQQKADLSCACEVGWNVINLKGSRAVLWLQSGLKHTLEWTAADISHTLFQAHCFIWPKDGREKENQGFHTHSFIYFFIKSNQITGFSLSKMKLYVCCTCAWYRHITEMAQISFLLWFPDTNGNGAVAQCWDSQLFYGLCGPAQLLRRVYKVIQLPYTTVKCN